MSHFRWCDYCKDYVPSRSFNSHRNQHEFELNSDAKDRKQYTGSFQKNNEDYMICVLHQKKCPCPVKNCNYIPFGMIRKSYMIRCAKGILSHKDEKPNTELEKLFLNYPSQRVAPFFPHTNMITGKTEMIPIDMSTKTVTIMGVSIFIRI